MKRLHLVRNIVQACIVIAAMTLLLSASDAPTADARFKDLGHRMMCTCGCGQVLLECNHVGCQSSDRMRAELAGAVGVAGGQSGGGLNLASGSSDDAIFAAFAQKYGPTVLAAPSTTGFGRVAWVTPFLALFAGIAALVMIVRAWKNRPAPALADGIAPAHGIEFDRFREQARKETDL
jgi:cytochrome c-type biogenesis protein CcmH